MTHLVLERVLGALLRREGRGFIDILGTQRRVCQHGHKVRLHFEPSLTMFRNAARDQGV